VTKYEKGLIYEETSLQGMKCPHCATAIHPKFINQRLDVSEERQKDCVVYYHVCPECREYLIYCTFIDRGGSYTVYKDPSSEEGVIMIFPRSKKPKPLPKNDVPDDYIKDYEEAYAVLTDSPKTSAALSRRLLQKLLRNKGNVRQGDLFDEIEQVINSHQLPQYLVDSIHNIRNTGNFAAHPRSTPTGEIIDVEPLEAEANLDVLELLFDWYFIQPAMGQRMKNAINQKLSSLRTPFTKTSSSQPSGSPSP